MRATYLLFSKLGPTANQSATVRQWKFPLHQKKTPFRIEISPKALFNRMLNAPNSSYYLCMAGIGVGGILGAIAQYFYYQYKLRTSGFALAAIKTLEKYPTFTDILGCPLKSSHILPAEKNSIKDDHVDVRMMLRGKKSSGILRYRASKHDDQWVIQSMDFTFIDRAGGKVRLVKDPLVDVDS